MPFLVGALLVVVPSGSACLVVEGIPGCANPPLPSRDVPMPGLAPPGIDPSPVVPDGSWSDPSTPQDPPAPQGQPVNPGVPVGTQGTVEVPSDGSSRFLSIPAYSTYELQASGTYQYSMNPGAYARADAAYSFWNPGDCASSGAGDHTLSLLVNNAFVWTGLACDPQGHIYTVTATCPGANPCIMEFRILDTYYADNSGALTVTLTWTGTQTGIEVPGVPTLPERPDVPPQDGDDRPVDEAPDQPLPGPQGTNPPTGLPPAPDVSDLTDLVPGLSPIFEPKVDGPRRCGNGGLSVAGSEARPCAANQEASTPEPPTVVVAAVPALASWTPGLWGGLAALGISFLLWPLLDPLYSRLLPSDLTVQPQRKKILELVRGRTAIALPTLMKETGLGRATLRYHLAVLARGGHVRLATHGGVTIVAVPNTPVPAKILERVAPAVGKVLDRLRSNPGRSQGLLAAELGLSQQRISFLLNRLAAQGIVEVRSDGAQRTYWPKPSA